jgi:sugar phosphate isomerase/epimerase
MTVQLALTPDGRWGFPAAELASAANAAGFTALGINVERVDEAASVAYASAGVRSHELLALVVGDDDSATMSAAERLADAAKTMNAEWVLTVFTTVPSAKIVARCAGMFDTAAAGMAVEFSPLGPVASIRHGMEIVRAANHGGRAGLLIDSWHFSFGESMWGDLSTIPLDDIAYVQFTDALEPEFRDRLVRESLHRRTLPGEGILELRRFAATLLERGWDGLVSVEVLSAELRELPVDVLTGRLYATTAPYWI